MFSRHIHWPSPELMVFFFVQKSCSKTNDFRLLTRNVTRNDTTQSIYVLRKITDVRSTRVETGSFQESAYVCRAVGHTHTYTFVSRPEETTCVYVTRLIGSRRIQFAAGPTRRAKQFASARVSSVRPPPPNRKITYAPSACSCQLCVRIRRTRWLTLLFESIQNIPYRHEWSSEVSGVVERVRVNIAFRT